MASAIAPIVNSISINICRIGHDLWHTAICKVVGCSPPWTYAINYRGLAKLVKASDFDSDNRGSNP